MIYINITNTITTKARTGIQRVVRELASRLAVHPDTEFVFWSGSEFCLIDKLCLQELLFQDSKISSTVPLKLNRLSSGDMFFDIDGSWGDPYDSFSLYLLLKKRGAIIVKLHYDSVPILFSNYSHPNTVFSFSENFASGLQFVDYWLCISGIVQGDFYKIAEKAGIGHPFSEIIQLGADFVNEKIVKKANGKDMASKYGRYILSVGTFEPRKNYETLVQLAEKLEKNGHSTNVVIAGKLGWNVEALAQEIREHSLFGTRLFWIENASDQDLIDLYKGAHIYVSVSHYEGFGLPVAEALARGCVTVCPRKTAMEEISRNACYYIKDNDVDSVYSAIMELEDEKIYTKYLKLAKKYIAPSWEEAALSIREFIEMRPNMYLFDRAVSQIVYISNSVDNLKKSLSSVQEHMSFISRAVILAPDTVVKEMSAELAFLEIEVTVIAESRLGLINLPSDHQERNSYLRLKLYESDEIDANFIASDDDYLVIDKVPPEYFQLGEKHIAYYFYEDGKNWPGGFPIPTSFDQGIWKTVRYLNGCGYNCRLFNSHQPQIINKRLAVEVLKRTNGLGMDEWSIYFNIAKHLFPSIFEESPYSVVFWPHDPRSWVPDVVLSNPKFQNYYYPDTDLSLVDQQSRCLAVEDYLKQLKHAQTLREAISPRIPSLYVKETSLELNFDEISCPSGVPLCIYLVSEVSEGIVSYEIDGHCTQLDLGNPPRIMFIPTEVYNGLTEAEVTVKFETSAHTATCIVRIRFCAP